MNLSVAAYQKLQNSWLLLKLSYGLLFVVAGVDKFFNFVTFWPQYVHPAIMANIDYGNLRILLAVVEITLGLLVLTRWTRAAAYGMALWFFIIVINLAANWSFLDVAARDTVLAVGALSLARLTEVISHERKNS